MKPLFYFGLLACACAAAGCSTQAASVASAATATSAAAKVDPPSQSDPFQLLAARVDGDSLVLTVQYSGGSAAHDFRLDPQGAPTKSLPRQQFFSLHHDAHGDLARALITEERAFDLVPYRDPRNAVVHLRLENWDETVVYGYER